MTGSHPGEQGTAQLTPVATHEAPTRGTGGLTWDGTRFWLADFEMKELLCLDPGSLAVQRRTLSQGTPGGLTWDGHLLWQAIFGAGVVVGLDPKTGQVRRRAALPEEQGPVHVAGLTWDGARLWCGSQKDGLLYAMDLREEAVDRTLSALAPLGGLAWDGSCLWAGGASKLRWDGDSWVEDAPHSYLLLKLDPEDGQVLNRYRLPFWPMGLTWDGSHMWVSDSQHGKLHQLAV